MKTRKKIFIKCRNGHWFCGKACPIDGYYDEFVDNVLAAEEVIRSRGDELTLETITKQGGINADAATARLILVETTDDVAEDQLCCLVERTE